jgi:transposase-like protein
MEFERQFPDDASCLEWLVERHYPEGMFCRKCNEITKHHRDTKRPSFACQNCGHHEHPMKGTIFEDSATSLKLWFYAIYIMSSTRCGISAKQLGREVGVTYKTAWRMFHLIRQMLEERDGDPLSGKVESDESFYGGKEKNKHADKKFSENPSGTVGKTAVWGVVERKGRIVAKVVPDTTKATILPLVNTHVLPATAVFTDEATLYDGLTGLGYKHQRVHHAAKVYVDGDAHTNTLEGFWSLTKNGIRGVYRNVSTKYLQMYLDEYAFRFNRRGHQSPMFLHFMHHVTRKISSAA